MPETTLSDHSSLEETIRRVVAEAPPFTAEQRDRLSVLLRPAACRELPHREAA